MSNKSRYNKETNSITRKAVEAVQKAMLRPTPSALVYGYLKEKDLSLKDMTVEQWKEIEKDLVEILLAEVYPGEDISEDQLNFTSLISSFKFMSRFIEQLEMNRATAIGEEDSNTEKPKQTSKKTFEV